MRRFFLLLLLLTTVSFHAQTVAERYLFEAANQERVSAGLSPLRWNTHLAAAARLHAERMAQHGTISHQFSGEPELTDRAAAAGTHFSMVEENVGVSPSALRMHDAWMHSKDHRANILAANVTSLGVAVVVSGDRLWAVEDFARDVEFLSLEEQEKRVGDLVASTRMLQSVVSSSNARKTCSMKTGYAGDEKPYFVMRYSSSDLSKLPEQLRERLQTGKFTKASIGACTSKASGFTAYSIAVMLFP